jgi:hypothetical protein
LGLAAAVLGCGDVLGIPDVTRLPPVTSGADASDVDAAPSPDGGGCPSGQKMCLSGECVGIEKPETGCADPTTCRPCSFPHASATCVHGECAVGPCDPPWIHCSGNPDDGCEIDPTSDDDNCSRCNLSCAPQAGGGCDKSLCTCSGVTCGAGVGCDSNGNCAP